MVYYTLFVLIGIIAGWMVSDFLNMPKPSKKKQFDIYIAGAIGIILGAKLPVFLMYGLNAEIIFSGKTLLGGLIGAFLTINFYKYITHRQDKALGGRFAIPLAVAVGFGKIGCYFNGCCGGEFFIPIQLIESAVQFLVAIGLYVYYKKTGRIDLLFPYYMLAYFIMRFFAEFIRTSESFALGLTVYQLAIILFTPIIILIIYKRRKIKC